jgi:hypothetical protein
MRYIVERKKYFVQCFEIDAETTEKAFEIAKEDDTLFLYGNYIGSRQEEIPDALTRVKVVTSNVCSPKPDLYKARS